MNSDGILWQLMGTSDRRSRLLLILFIFTGLTSAQSAIGQTPLPSSDAETTVLECPIHNSSTPIEQVASNRQLTEEISGETLEFFRVTGFEFIGNTVFSQAELDRALVEFRDRDLRFADLIEAVSIVTKLYNDDGYLNSYAVPYEQKITDGIIKIAIIEGGLGTISLIRQGRGRLRPQYICRRLAIASAPLNTQKLLHALRLLQLDPLIANLSANLVEGPRPEEHDLQLYFEETPTFNIDLGADNSRAPSVGSFRRHIQLSHQNLLGFGDRLYLAYSNTDGSDNFSTSYTIPLNARNGILRLAYGTATNRVIEPPFNAIDLRGDSRYFDITLRQPLWQNEQREFGFGVGFARRETDTSILGSSFPLSQGGDRRGRTRLSVLQVSQDALWRGERQSFIVQSQFNFGLGLFGATARSQPPDGRFFAWRGQAQWLYRFAPNTLLLVKSNLQLSDRELVSLERFGLGGAGTVRGYRQEIRLTDNGALASVELRYPIIGNTQSQWGMLQVAPFIDLGTGWNHDRDSNLSPQTLASVGLGLRWQMRDRARASLYWGFPLVDVDSRDRTWQENGLHFSVQTRFSL
ncbi:ShlB/FhaC/HecB family hemolysin secretion/activation protein [Roseofilum casamattae]|uniref:ShlB/FhaC/HecB family hemolysin secretion/activation protein n=1 Tax=Roseofilum casamattae BLCC-M143 TaxID=3022442 RepID=A0ABT7C1M9_9CYAN|nr:ShlB/FhaC/HecB family hemolysin secretion/activation protein [Roseofilum casamattae]MDJ1184433.1 ShlB/FhaC/HecB family hemolysin secretion/activation protein [Roseofilum casamattae BLCC-M143]